jgi:hypothetical protein
VVRTWIGESPAAWPVLLSSEINFLSNTQISSAIHVQRRSGMNLVCVHRENACPGQRTQRKSTQESSKIQVVVGFFFSNLPVFFYSLYNGEIYVICNICNVS